MKNLNLIIILFFISANIMAQNKVLKVWPDGAPDSNEMEEPQITSDNGHISKISEAEMFVYLPEKSINTGAAVVICPGGGYWIEAMEHEGHAI
ncbi:MAG: hypothetical protein L3J54_14650, partial [Draconibacterium sp.]|nr:hypothetical protein [Draconibacterium sp.]